MYSVVARILYEETKKSIIEMAKSFVVTHIRTLETWQRKPHEPGEMMDDDVEMIELKRGEPAPVDLTEWVLVE